MNNKTIEEEQKNLIKIYQSENYDKLISELDTFVENFGESDFTFSLLGNAYFNTKQFSKSIGAFQNELKISSGDHHLPHFNLGRNYEELKENTKAIDHYMISYNLNPKKFETSYNLAMLHVTNENYSNAKDFFEIAYSINSNHPNMIINYLSLLHKTKNYDEAVDIGKKADRRMEKFYQFTFNFALHLYEIGDMEKSEIMNEKAINSINDINNPVLNDCLTLKANLLNYANKNNEAVNIGFKILKKDPYNYGALKTLSVSFAHLGNHQTSIMFNRLADGNVRFENKKEDDEINLFIYDNEKVLIND